MKDENYEIAEYLSELSPEEYTHLICSYEPPTRRERMKRKTLIFFLSLWVLICLAVLAVAAYVICGGVV